MFSVYVTKLLFCIQVLEVEAFLVEAFLVEAFLVEAFLVEAFLTTRSFSNSSSESTLNIFVSSANKYISDLTTSGKSFMYTLFIHLLKYLTPFSFTT